LSWRLALIQFFFAKLHHPNIVAIHEIGEHEGRHFFSMDYIEGPSLQEAVRREPLTPKRAATCVQTQTS
jgi:serine/threonine protein kinase